MAKAIISQTHHGDFFFTDGMPGLVLGCVPVGAPAEVPGFVCVAAGVPVFVCVV